ncbi:hypothetical protein [Aquincola sp. J276]|uniref:hypothetical protein n=1 Tax=Aquincola sp. J276 TaxID=2898432 RepID=UPI00215103D0|nr:hypothetical protein [Aquincola sp. J276]MCR5864646.1 hypothetical protein [Aquincola sp. J276]
MRTGLSAPSLVVLNGANVPAVLFVELRFDAVVRLCSAAVDFEWAGELWRGTGSLGTVSAVKDTSNGETTALQLTLSGVPTENIALALGERPRGRPCRVWFGVLDPETHALLDAPLIFSGAIDQMPISRTGETCTIAVTVEHQGKLFGRPKPLRYTSSDQQKTHAGDTCMRFLVSQAQHNDVWPAAAFFKQ